MKEQGQSAVPTNDEKIVDMYWERNPDAIQETDKKYGKVLRSVAYNILFDDLDREECQNDTYLGVWNAIPSTRPAVFSAFIMRIMRWTAISRYKEKSRKKRIPSQLTISLDELADSISSGVQIEEEYESKQLGKLISDYVWSLNEKQRYLFVDRYYLAEPVEKTASDLSVSTQSVYRELRKIKQGLKEYLERNGVHI
jgi:RNA polymerase sigma-70 factor (ECF subfamily)